MQQLPNLVGKIVTVQPLAAWSSLNASMAVCVEQSASYIVVVALEGGVLARLRTLPLTTWEVIGWFEDTIEVARVVDSIESALNSTEFTTTEDGRSTLTDAFMATGRILSDCVRQDRHDKQAAEDAALAAAREADEQRHNEVFGHFDGVSRAST